MTSPWQPVLVLLLLASPLAQAYSRKPVESLQKDQMMDLPTHLQIDSSSNPWEGYTGSYEEEQAGYRVEPKALDSTWARLETLADYSMAGDSLIAVDRKSRRVHLSSVHFSGSFERVDATRLGASTKKFCGGLKASSPLLKQPAKLVRFLLQSHLIRTYIHLESSLDLVRESASDDGRFVSQWQGKHIYFTNDRNVSPVRFSVIVDIKTGVIEVVGD